MLASSSSNSGYAGHWIDNGNFGAPNDTPSDRGPNRNMQRKRLILSVVSAVMPSIEHWLDLEKDREKRLYPIILTRLGRPIFLHQSVLTFDLHSFPRPGCSDSGRKTMVFNFLEFGQ
ncbi:hypothetical protein CVT26_008338 [Gymnopilus dilepis]|uniref:Uncharacterized protein n=1 Tax=Gymnopilus dilepis TaxID=231916 RepID=A0A409XY38_9AGAR|nr:hypothetical protein CVT26_008338 [Gymnopilus dilepis]